MVQGMAHGLCKVIIVGVVSAIVVVVRRRGGGELAWDRGESGEQKITLVIVVEK